MEKLQMKILIKILILILFLTGFINVVYADNTFLSSETETYSHSFDRQTLATDLDGNFLDKRVRDDHDRYNVGIEWSKKFANGGRIGFDNGGFVICAADIDTQLAEVCFELGMTPGRTVARLDGGSAGLK